VDTDTLHRFVAITANLEGPEEELEGENPAVRDRIPVLSGNAWQYACFHLNAV
jgi:hypothetical protein